MEPVNLVVTTPIGEPCLSEIAGLDPRIRVRDVSDLAKAESQGDYSRAEEFDGILAETQVVYGLRLPQNLVTRAPKLRWVQVLSAGVDRYLATDIRTSPVTLTNASGIHATPIAEFVMEQMLMFAKRASDCFEMKQTRRWARYTPTVLKGKTVGIVGLGKIGRETARLSKAFGMRVMATRRSTRRIGRGLYVDVMLPRDELPQLLAESDYVVITLPHTKETTGLIGKRELGAMKPSAFIINIGRGSIIDEGVLITALRENRIAGAGLDVFATEPLPPESPLWDMPNVFISPHVSGGREDYNVHANAVFCNNLRRYLAGQRLLNVVGKQRGY